jgi:hypothetical protein
LVASTIVTPAKVENQRLPTRSQAGAVDSQKRERTGGT